MLFKFAPKCWTRLLLKVVARLLLGLVKIERLLSPYIDLFNIGVDSKDLTCYGILAYGFHCLFFFYLKIKFFNVGPPKECIFLTTIYGLCFSHHYTYTFYKLHFFHDVAALITATVPYTCPKRDLIHRSPECTIY